MEPFKRILLVEDGENKIHQTIDVLSQCLPANNIDIASDGEEAMDYLFSRGKHKERKSGNPILTILDIKLPKATGLEILQTMKDDEYLRTIPVVILTSSEEESDMIDSYRMGVNAYVVKPLEAHRFAEAVKDLCLFWTQINEPPPVVPKK